MYSSTKLHSAKRR